MSKTLFLKYPYGILFNEHRISLQNHAIKRCGECQCTLSPPDPCCLQLLSTCRSIQECRVTAAPTASCLSKVTFPTWLIHSKGRNREDGEHQFPTGFCSYLRDLGNSSFKSNPEWRALPPNSLPVLGIKCSASTMWPACARFASTSTQSQGWRLWRPLLHSTAGSGNSLPSTWLLAQGLNGLATSLPRGSLVVPSSELSIWKILWPPSLSFLI